MFRFLCIIHTGNIKHQSDDSPNRNSDINKHPRPVSQSFFLGERIVSVNDTIDFSFIENRVEYRKTDKNADINPY